MKDNYYKILGVPRDAKPNRIKQAYRRAVLRNHPDWHPNDEKKQENMKIINEAYSVLGNPKRRAEYDRAIQSFESFNPYKNLAYMLLAWAELWFKYTLEINRLYLSIISLKRP